MSIATAPAVPSDVSNGMVGENTIKATTRGESVVAMDNGMKPRTLNPLLHVPDMEHILVSL